MQTIAGEFILAAVGREDLAKAALIERQKAADMAEGLQAEIDQIEETLKGYEADIAKLQGKLREARSRQNSIAARYESAVTRARARWPGRRSPRSWSPRRTVSAAHRSAPCR